MEQSEHLLFYPMYGVCILEAVEKKKDLENHQTMYQLFFPKQEMRMFVPEQRAQQKYIRPLSDVDSLLNSRALFFGDYTQMTVDPSERRTYLQARIESGLLDDHFGIIRDMICVKGYDLKLNAHDRSVLAMAREMLVNELMYVLNISADDASTYLKEDMEKRQIEFTSCK